MATRPLIYAANWKMHHGPSAAREFLTRFLQVTAPVAGRRLWFFPPSVSIGAAYETASGREDVTVGAQNVHWEPKGAFTGELSIPLVMEAGARAALIGHSERRHLFGETDEQVARKLGATLKAGMIPLVCVGETLAEREGGRTEQVVTRQVAALQERISSEHWSRVVLAYEPVWAIGTGRNATPDDAAQVHELIRFELGRRGVPGRVTILYGGSVNQGNVISLLARPELDGVLVGGASLDPDGWAELVGHGG
ncbi:MAG TPA: triose-phosphate isomerase [Gemmatimonadales bacterium]|jgi:triosephosphate isomerase (TIM)|nr:triose-phosphate isomerase [Gemmatimonadales bacterium]